MTKILWLVKGLGRGGAEMLLVGLARAMDRTDLDIHVAYRLPHKDALVEDLRSLRVTVHALGASGSPWQRDLFRLLSREQFDVVHSHAPLVGSAARLLAPRNATLLHTEHNSWDRYHPATRLINRWTLRRNDRVWAVSDEVLHSMSRGAGSTRCEVMLHGIDPADAHRGPESRAEARRRLGVNGTDLVIGTVGNLAPKKDQRTLIAAFGRLVGQVPDARLVIVGTGPLEHALKHQVADLGLTVRVSFLGMRTDVPRLLPGFDIFALPSRHEGLSIAVLEAMAAGVPVVCSRIGGLPQLVAPDHGILVPPRDPDGLARELIELSSDQGTRDRLAAQGPARAAEFGIQTAADTLAHAYRHAGRHRAGVGG